MGESNPFAGLLSAPDPVLEKPKEDPNPFAGLLTDDIAKDEQARSYTAWRSANADVDPKTAVDVLKHVAATGAPAGTVAANLDEYRKQVDQRTLTQALASRPHLARLMQDAARAPLVKDDVEHLGWLEWMLTGRLDYVPDQRWTPDGRVITEGGGWTYTGPFWARAFSQGTRDIEQAHLSTLQALSFPDPGGGRERRVGYLEDASAVDFSGGNKLAALLAGAARAAPMLIARTAAGKVGGALAGAVLPGGGAAVGKAMGELGGGAAFDWWMNVGGLYRQLREIPGVTHEEARDFAMVASLANAATTGLIGAGLPAGFGGVLSKATGTGIQKALSDLTAGRAWRDLIARYTGHVAMGGLFMASQSAGNAATVELARSEHGQAPEWGRVTDAAGHAFKQGIQDFALLSLWGPGRQFLAERGQAVRLEASARADAVETAAARDSSFLKRSPEEAQKFLQTLAEQGDGPTRFVDRLAWDKLWQEQKLDPREAAAEVIGDGGKAYDAALQSGGDLAVPAGAYIAKIARTPMADALRPDVKRDAEGLTPRQNFQAIEALQKRVEELRKGSLPAGDPMLSIRENEAARARAAGVKSDEADAFGALRAANAVALSERYGGTPEEWIARLGSLNIVRGGQPGPAAMEQPAWHGSPHVFDRFSMDAVGTGEGAQVYGHGLYFAQNKEVADFYRNTLSSASVKFKGMDADAVESAGREAEAWALVHLKAAANAVGDRGTESVLQHARDLARKFANGNRADVQKGRLLGVSEATLSNYDAASVLLNEAKPSDVQIERGAVFKVDVPPSSKLLDYDEPMHAQPEAVRAALARVTPEALGLKLVHAASPHGVIGWQWARPTGERVGRLFVYKRDAEAVLKTDNDASGETFYRRLADIAGSPRAASEALRKAGVPGLQYLDQGSRAGGKGTHNYVIWDEPSIKVLERLQQEGLPIPVPDGETVTLRHTAGRGYIEFAPGGAGEPLRADIHLLAGADRSTLAHETGHFLTEALARVAGAEGAPEPLRADMEALAKWAGYGSLAERQAGLKTPAEEKISHAWEQYLAEGKAPSSALVSVFQRFKQWMLAIYKGVQGIAGAYKARYGEDLTVSPEVRAIFDRWLAAEDATAAQRKAQDVQPFKLTPEEAQRHADLSTRAQAEAELEVVRFAAAAGRRETDTFLKSERATIEKTVTAEVDSNPAQRALAFLARGEDPGASAASVPEARALHALLFPGGKPVKLDRQTLVDRYGEPFVKALPRAMTSKDGVHHDYLAEHFGFQSGDEMVRAVASAEPREVVIGRETQRRMAEAFPELLNRPEELTAAALDGAHGSAEGQKLVLEARALRRQLDPATDPRAPVADQGTVRAFAEAQVRTMRVGDLQPSYFLQAERNSAARALEAAAGGKLGEAFDHKEAQRFSMEMWRAARDARAEAESDVAALRAFTGDAQRAKLGLAGPEYRDQVDGLLEHFELSPSASRQEVAERIGTAAFIARENAEGRDPIVPDSVMAKLDRQVHWKELTPAELRDLRAAVESIAHQAELKRTILTLEGRKAEADAVAEMVQGIGWKPPQPPSDSGSKAKPFGENVGVFANKALKSIEKIEELTRQLDRGDINGPFTTYIWNPINEASNRWVEVTRQTTKAIVDAIEAFPEADRRRWLETRFTVGGVGYTLQDALVVALNSGNASNLRKLIEGRQHESYTGRGFQAWDGNTPGEFLRHLTKRDAELVQTVWDSIESLWPEIETMNARLTGLSPAKIEAKPLQFTTADGEQVTLRGGYYPVIYDSQFPGAGPRAEEAAALKQLALFNPGYVRAVTPQGHLQDRVEEYSRPISLSLDGLARHITQATKDLTFREAAISVNKLLQNDVLRRELQARSPGDHEQMVGWLRDVVNDLTVPDNGSKTWLTPLARFRSNFTVALFAYNIGQTLQNLAGVIPAARYVGVGRMLDSVLDFAKDGSGMVDRISALSLEMKNRSYTGQAGVGEALRELENRSGAVARVGEFGLAMFEATDRFVAFRTWWAAFQKAGGEGVTQEQAVRMADQTVRLKVMSGATKDLPALTRSPVGKLFAPLMGFAINRVNQVWGSVADARVANSDGHKWAATKIIGGTLLALALEDILSELVTGKGPQDATDDGQVTGADWAAWFAKTAVLSVPKKIPVLGGIIRSAEGGHDVSFNPETRFMTLLAKSGMGAWKLAAGQDPVDSDRMLAEAGLVLEGAGWALGLPTAQVATTVKYLRAVQTGDENPQGLTQYGLGLAFGKKRPGKLAAAIE